MVPPAKPAVLIIEDDDACASLLADFATAAGAVATRAANGREGIALLARANFDIVITDIFMPAEDGFAVMRAALGTAPHVPVVAVSGGSRVVALDIARFARLLGAHAVFPKPLSPEAFIAALRQLLGAARHPLHAAA